MIAFDDFLVFGDLVAKGKDWDLRHKGTKSLINLIQLLEIYPCN